MLNIEFDRGNPSQIVDITYISIAKIPYKFKSGWYATCQGRAIIGGGEHGNQTVELDGISWNADLPSTKVQRWESAFLYHQETGNLIVAGGRRSNRGYIDTIECLKIDSDGNGSEWMLLKSTLPKALNGHTLTEYQSSIILIGGHYDGEVTNEVWKGIFQDNEIQFEALPPMKQKRHYHFAFHVCGKIYVFGGENRFRSCVEVFNGDNWQDGIQIPCKLSRWDGDSAIMNRHGKIMILSNKMGIGIFDPEEQSVNFFNSQFKMREDDREYYAAVLI